MKTQTVPSIVPQKPRVNARVRDLPPSGIRKFFDLVATKPGVISLGVGEPDFVTPWHICEAGIHALEVGRTSYTSNLGLMELREEAAAFYERNYHYQYDPAGEILITVGGSEAIDLVFRSVLERGDEAIVIDPSFVSYAPLVTLAGGEPVRVPTEPERGFVPRRADLERAVTPQTRMLVLNYPNNPTGAALTREQAAAIVDFALGHHLLVVSDELYLQLTYDGEEVSFGAFPELREQLILIHGFSKSWAMTGWRLGIALGPGEFIDAMMKVHQYSIMCAPTLAQYGALEALKHGDEEVERMRKEYDARRRFITHHLNRIGLSCVPPKGAFYIFPSIRSTGMSSEEFATRLLEEENVAVIPGSAFGDAGEGHVRCSYAASLEQIREAVIRIERFVTRNRAADS